MEKMPQKKSPTTIVMIQEVIKELNHPRGSSASAIMTAVIRNYELDPVRGVCRITKALASAVENFKLVQIKSTGYYKLPKSEKPKTVAGPNTKFSDKKHSNQMIQNSENIKPITTTTTKQSGTPSPSARVKTSSDSTAARVTPLNEPGKTAKPAQAKQAKQVQSKTCKYDDFCMTTSGCQKVHATILKQDRVVLDRWGDLMEEFLKNSQAVAKIKVHQLLERSNVGEAIRKTFEIWMERESAHATFSAMISIFRENDCIYLAEKLEKSVEEIRGKPPRSLKAPKN